MKTLSGAGDPMILPCVTLIDDGREELLLKVSRYRGGRQTQEMRLTRQELFLIAQAVFDALDWPK